MINKELKHKATLNVDNPKVISEKEDYGLKKLRNLKIKIDRLEKRGLEVSKALSDFLS